MQLYEILMRYAEPVTCRVGARHASGPPVRLFHSLLYFILSATFYNREQFPPLNLWGKRSSERRAHDHRASKPASREVRPSWCDSRDCRPYHWHGRSSLSKLQGKIGSSLWGTSSDSRNLGVVGKETENKKTTNSNILSSLKKLLDYFSLI